MTDKHIDTAIAPDVQLRKTLTNAYIEYTEAYATIDTQLRLYGKTNSQTVNNYINATIKAINMIQPFLQKDKFKKIRQEVSKYVVVGNWQDLVVQRNTIKELMDKSYYLTGIIEIDQAQKIRIYDLDTEMRQIVHEFLQEKLKVEDKQ
jgi:hypothetical protein